MNSWKKRAQHLEMMLANLELSKLNILDEYIDLFKLSFSEANHIRLRSFKRAKNIYAQEIKLLKKNIKILNPFDVGDQNIKKDLQARLVKQRKRQRLCHILYSIARGRTLEEVERNTKQKLNWEKINELIEWFGLHRFEHINNFVKTKEEE